MHLIKSASFERNDKMHCKAAEDAERQAKQGLVLCDPFLAALEGLTTGP